MLINTPVRPFIEEFAFDVRSGLTRHGQKELPSKYLYDAVGSKLFEVISELPEYGLTRADERLIQRHAGEIASAFNGDTIICELGSGSGRKTRYLLEAFCRRQETTYYPIEISNSALAHCERELSNIEGLRIAGLESEYMDGILEVASRRKQGQRILVLFLGSTIGNFGHPHDVDFLREIRSVLRPGDGLLLGTDLIKPIEQLIPAYDDELGVTAAFNRNLLTRINHELGANFVLPRFQHAARFNFETGNIEMHLRSTQRQTVHIPVARCTATFGDGETIWTESSHKYTTDEIDRLTRDAGFTAAERWTDREWLFVENLMIVK